MQAECDSRMRLQEQVLELQRSSADLKHQLQDEQQRFKQASDERAHLQQQLQDVQEKVKQAFDQTAKLTADLESSRAASTRAITVSGALPVGDTQVGVF